MSKIYFQLAYIHNEDIYYGNDTSSRNELNKALPVAWVTNLQFEKTGVLICTLTSGRT